MSHIIVGRIKMARTWEMAALCANAHIQLNQSSPTVCMVHVPAYTLVEANFQLSKCACKIYLFQLTHSHIYSIQQRSSISLCMSKVTQNLKRERVHFPIKPLLLPNSSQVGTKIIIIRFNAAPAAVPTHHYIALGAKNKKDEKGHTPERKGHVQERRHDFNKHGPLVVFGHVHSKAFQSHFSFQMLPSFLFFSFLTKKKELRPLRRKQSVQSYFSDIICLIIHCFT